MAAKRNIVMQQPEGDEDEEDHVECPRGDV